MLGWCEMTEQYYWNLPKTSFQLKLASDDLPMTLSCHIRMGDYKLVSVGSLSRISIGLTVNLEKTKLTMVQSEAA